MMRRLACALLAGLAVFGATTARAGIQTVFYIEMENHNFMQPASQASPQQIFGNPAAPYINSLITPGNPNAAQVSWTPNYFSVGASVHPSLPNYLWQEAGTNFGITNDNQPFSNTGTNPFSNPLLGANANAPSLSALLQAKGISWKSYQEDTNINLSTGAVLPQSQWTVPLLNKSGTIAGYANPYNGRNQYDFGTKHDGQLYFSATNGNGDPTTNNPSVSHYAPLQQLATDLANNTVARYNLITPDQFNDMHTSLSGGFTYRGTAYTGDAANIAQGDNFLSIIVPQIMASQAYQNNGAIVIWWDETENGDTTARTLADIVISPLAKGNGYASPFIFSHSSDLKTLQELFGVPAPGGGFLGDANNPLTNDLSDLFVPGALPVPEPSTFGLFALGATALGVWRRRRKPAA
jgi:hypothetical protein